MSNDFLNALRVAHQQLADRSIRWMLIGSGNCFLQGMDVDPGDLDIAMTREDLEKVPEIFSDHNQSTIECIPTITQEPASRTVFFIDGFEVEVVGEEPNSLYVEKLLSGMVTHVTYDGMNIPCLRLPVEADCYEQTGREERAERTRAFAEERK